MTTLPPAFVDRMRELLGDDVERFVASFERPRSRALRVNPLKTDADELRRLLGVELRPLPWSQLGFEIAGDAPPLGTHPAHLAGLFYLQEPSSIAVAEAVRPEPEWRVADVAAAPGGKTTHLASLVGEGGVVVANEISRARLRVLHENVDRWGSPNVVTTQLSLAALAAAVEEPFDAVVLDAPCTGEGLFRRDPKLVREWSPRAVAGAARRQAGLLDEAARIVRPGGVLVYSTCSFELEENEENVSAFLGRNAEWSLEDAVRLWPHEAPGEGQFFARLRREGTAVGAPHRRPRENRSPVLRAWRKFAPELDLPEERLVVRGDSIFLAPERAAGVPAARPGMPLGTARPGRFEPAHPLAASPVALPFRSRVSWPADDPRLQSYLRGETVPSAGEDGWVLVCYERWGLGWARRTGGVLKNFFPRSYRLSSTARL
jgi:16S rRNA C967 or C1407 C5-methylase (RsmB/RsmF family)/NOL1/NOP2/fmu family ribosome biogenesis protein